MPSPNVFNQGYYKRARRRVHVLRGFDAANPSTLTEVAPVKAEEQGTIKSGMLISLEDVNGVMSWVKGAAKGKTPYIALSDDTDTDVNSSGLLPALSCAGEFEIETAYFNTGKTGYNVDVPLIASTSSNAGEVEPGSWVSGAATDIVGVITKGVVDLGRAGGFPVQDNTATDARIITFRTQWTPART